MNKRQRKKQLQRIAGRRSKEAAMGIDYEQLIKAIRSVDLKAK